MMGERDKQPQLYHTVQLEDLVPADHPLRRIRPMIDAERIRRMCADLYCADNGRPSIPPEQLFLALLGGYLPGMRSDRKLIMELQCNMAFRWFVGLDIDARVWDASSFSKNRKHRFDGSDILQKLFDATVEEAIEKGWVSYHWSVDGTLVRANASQKSFVPIEVYERPEVYRQKLAGEEAPKDGDDQGDPGNPDRDWRGQKRSNGTHQSTSDPDARLGRKSDKEGAYPTYTVNAIMENKHRFLMGINVERFQGPKSETRGAIKLLSGVKQTFYTGPKTLGGDKGYFSEKFLKALWGRKIFPHIAAKTTGKEWIHEQIRKLSKTYAYRLSQRARKKIEALWGEAKDQHDFRRFRRRRLRAVRQEALMMGWALNLKRMASMAG